MISALPHPSLAHPSHAHASLTQPRAARWPQALCAGLALATVLLLQGCAGGVAGSSSAARPTPAAAADAAPASASGTAWRRAPISPQQQAELDAAMSLVRARRYDQGLEALVQLAKRMPGHPVPLINQALVHKQLGRHAQAQEQLQEALRMDPDDPLAANELALLYRQQGRFAEARPVYERMLALYPNFALGHKNLGVLCDLYLRDYECALCHYKRYSSFAPDDANVRIWIADLEKRVAAK